VKELSSYFFFSAIAAVAAAAATIIVVDDRINTHGKITHINACMFKS
jgi:hypothetical protein